MEPHWTNGASTVARARHVLRNGNCGKVSRDLKESGFSCQNLCDGCVDFFGSHNPDNSDYLSQESPPLVSSSILGRMEPHVFRLGSFHLAFQDGHSVCVSLGNPSSQDRVGGQLPAFLESMWHESFRQLPVGYWRCDSYASVQPGPYSSAPCALVCAHRGWHLYKGDMTRLSHT